MSTRLRLVPDRIESQIAGRMVGDARTALYRHYCDLGLLLYVGISCNPLGRLANHKAASCWSREITSVTLEYFATRAEAEQAEREAIKSENPIYNISHSTTPQIKIAHSAKAARRARLYGRFENEGGYYRMIPPEPCSL